MTADYHSDIFTVGIGGAAGDGVMEAGSNLGLLLRDLGYEAYLSTNYPSLIRGGHNFVRVSFSKEKIWTDHAALDVLIALNEETITLHRPELAENAVVFADAFEPTDVEALGANAVVVPMRESAKKISAPDITRTSVALGALCYLLDLPLPKMTEILRDVFANKKMEENVALADVGYEHLQNLQFRHSKKIDIGEELRKSSQSDEQLRQRDTEFLDGNTAFAKGLQTAGLDFYLAYPMTPASTILHYLAREQKKDGLKVIQPENEISVINMALGMAYAGKRVAVGSATGGFALMQEALSFAGGAELPLAIAVSQRQAPATGVPTHSSQSDLRFAIHGGHGEFPRIVIAPGDTEECFYAGRDALNLAWKFQTPVIILLDKILSEHATTVRPSADVAEPSSVSLAEIVPGRDYNRYAITPDGVSPLAFPGTPGAVVKVTSYEHDEHGITTEESAQVTAMIDKRFAKAKSIEAEMKKRDSVKVYGDTKSKNIVVFFGSTKCAVLEAAKFFTTPVKLVQIVWLEPFDAEKVARELAGAEKILCVEGNHTAQLASLIREKTGIAVTEKILKYDSMPFDPIALAEEINKILK